MNTRIDHFMLAAPSLALGQAWAKQTFGSEPAYGGAHDGMGTCNALLSLDSAYLEIIAPDPEQPLTGTFGERLAQLTGCGLVTWAVEAPLNNIAEVLNEAGIRSAGPTTTRRMPADGPALAWRLLFPLHSGFGTRLPFFIDWEQTTNPRQTAPKGGRFSHLEIEHPNAAELQQTLQRCGLETAVGIGAPRLSVHIETRLGTVRLDCTDETRELNLLSGTGAPTMSGADQAASSQRRVGPRKRPRRY